MKGRLLLGAAVALAFATSNAVSGISGGGKVVAGNSELILLGPVEAIKDREGVVVVLGQKLSQRAVGQVEIGQTLAVFGSVNADGALAVSSVQSLGFYVPGATNIVVTGVVQKVNPALGRATVGGLSVDTTAVTTIDQSEAVSVGALVQVAGTQPVGGGLLLAQGISGGGKVASGISGGGKVTSGISGGGFTASGISGGGKVASGISGGGKVTSGISGGGFTASGISGGGKVASGISGGGKVASGISGGGFTASGISGGGKVASGISGGGKVANGISGGG